MNGTLATALRATRKASRRTLKDLEALTGLHNGYLSQLETGKVTRPSARTLTALSAGYGIPMPALLRLAGAGVDAQAWTQEVPAPLPEFMKDALNVLTAEDWEALRGTVEWMTAMRRAQMTRGPGEGRS